MAQVDKNNRYVMVSSQAVAALANNGTSVIQLADDVSVEGLCPYSVTAAGVISVQAAATFSAVFNNTLKQLTFTNLTGSAFTGTYYVSYPKA